MFNQESRSSGEIERSRLVSRTADGRKNVTNGPTAQTLSFPDSLVPLYIAFLAWDKFIATHDADGSAGAPKVPGESDSELDSDTEKVTRIALSILDDLIKEASASLDEEDLSSVKTSTREFVQEL